MSRGMGVCPDLVAALVVVCGVVGGCGAKKKLQRGRRSQAGCQADCWWWRLNLSLTGANSFSLSPCCCYPANSLWLQAFGQAIWCAAHTLWVGNSFMVATSLALMAHHAFGCWHGDRRLADKYGEAFEKVCMT